MTKRQARKAIALHNASLAAMADAPDSELLTEADYDRVGEAQEEWGMSVLRRYGYERPFCTFDECVKAALDKTG
jgi:hypothetical protein